MNFQEAFGKITDAATAKLNQLSDQAVADVVGAIGPSTIPANPARADRIGTDATGKPVVEAPQAQPKAEWPAWVKPVGIGIGVALVAGIIWQATRSA